MHEPATSRQNRCENPPQNDRQNDRLGDRQQNRNPRSRRPVDATGRRSLLPAAQRAGRNAPIVVREATLGALQALAVIASFVVVGLGWAILADAGQLARDSVTRYRGDPVREDRTDRATNIQPRIQTGYQARLQTPRRRRRPSMNVPADSIPSPKRGCGWSTDTTPSTAHRFAEARAETNPAAPTSPKRPRPSLNDRSGPIPCASAWSLSPGASRILTLRSGSSSMAVVRPRTRSVAINPR